MKSHIRNVIFEPLRAGTLSAIVPRLTVTLPTRQISAPAQLRRDDDGFEFILHFEEAAPPKEFTTEVGRIYTEADQLTCSGEISGEVAFSCTDVFPPSCSTTRSRGTCTVTLRSSRMNLLAEGHDRLSAFELHRLIGSAEMPSDVNNSFRAHVIFHGPKLKLIDSGTESVEKNDFLGEATRSMADTHQFDGDYWEGALIQKDAELHLHLRSKKDSATRFSESMVAELVDQVSQAVGFVLGFQPWPAYRELRLNHVIVERWIRPQFDLDTTFLVPVSGEEFLAGVSSPLRSIIPTITQGLARLPNKDRERLSTLLWHFRSATLSELPATTRILIVCAVLDGLMKLIAGSEKASDKTTKVWRAASDAVGISWERWTSEVFELWGRHRHTLSHGRLWVEEDDDVSFFTDYPRLGCAFLTLVAAYCGYDGPILADPYSKETVSIRGLKETTADSTSSVPPR